MISTNTVLGPFTGTPTVSSNFAVINNQSGNYLIGPNAYLSNISLTAT